MADESDIRISQSVEQSVGATTTNTCEDSEVTRPKRKALALRSTVWEHFVKLDGDKKAKCQYCGNLLACGPVKNGTTSLKKHLGICTTSLKKHLGICKKYPANITIAERQQELKLVAKDEGNESSLTNWKFDQQRSRKDLATMIIEDEFPFSIVEGRGFRRFISGLQHKFFIPSRFTVRRDCFQFYEDEKDNLKKLFKSSCRGVCLTTDTWTSDQQINYMCLTAHFIDDEWVLQKRIINFCPVFSHKGDDLGKSIEKCLKEWGLDRVFSVTVDNASANDVAIGYLKKKMINKGTCVANGKFMHVRCVAHILNLIVQDGLKDVSSSVNRVRATIRFIRCSPARLKKFKDCAEIDNLDSKKGLCLDVSTRWNSTYTMLKVALYYSKAFERYEENDPYFRADLSSIGAEWAGVPKDDDWESIKKLVVFLEHFFDLTLKVSETQYVTSSTFCHDMINLYLALKKWQMSDDVNMNVMATKMKTKFDKYWGDLEKMNLTIFIAVILDPRYKLEYVGYGVSEMYGPRGDAFISKIKDTVIALFEEYKSRNVGDGDDDSESSQKARDGIPIENDIVAKFKKHKGCFGGLGAKSELNMYLTEFTAEDKKGFDILKWWYMNSSRYPILSLMARDLLAVPISTVASESAFSTGGRVLNPFRSSLTPKIFQCLLCAQDWMRLSLEPIKIEENLEELEKFEEEFTKDGGAIDADISVI